MPSTPHNKEAGLFDCPDDTEHASMRKLISPILSDRGIRDRESLLLKHMKHFIEELTRATEKTSSGAIDMLDWYPRVAFDIVGELVNGQDLGGV
jgi:cytochrome P450